MSTLELAAPGAAELGASLTAAGHQLGDLTDPHREAGRIALDAAVIPRRTGHLAETATVAATADGWALTATAAYAGYVHARDPFFTRAIGQQVDAITGVYVEHVTDALNTVGA